MEQFVKYLNTTSLNQNTIRSHIRHLNRFDYNLHADEKELVKYIKDKYTIGSPRQTITISILKYRGYYKLPVEVLRCYLKKSHQETLDLQAERTRNIEIPTIEELKERLNEYYKNEKWREYCVMYLLLTFQTRNLDLVLKIVSDKNEINDKDNFIYIRGNDCVYIRNSYKTVNRYGTKRHIIKTKKFNRAIRNLEVGEVLLHDNYLTYQVKKITGYNESTLMKFSVMQNNTLNDLMKISHNRGTSVPVIYSSYNINKDKS